MTAGRNEPDGGEEIFDVVNERDEIIGQATRSEVHRCGWRHRAVHVLVFNRRGEVFLQKRSMQKDCHPGVWDSSASGHLGPGESYEAGAVRELAEELGLTIGGEPKRWFRVEACEATGQEFVWVYRVEAEGPFTLHPVEISAGGWFGVEAVDRWIAGRPDELSPAFRHIWEQAG